MRKHANAFRVVLAAVCLVGASLSLSACAVRIEPPGYYAYPAYSYPAYAYPAYAYPAYGHSNYR